jgi:hypothetical protein
MNRLESVQKVFIMEKSDGDRRILIWLEPGDSVMSISARVQQLITAARRAPQLGAEEELAFVEAWQERQDRRADGDYKYYETIDSRALDTCDMSDVCFRYNHRDDVMIMACFWQVKIRTFRNLIFRAPLTH